ncbi:MAG: sulfatase-like hydrolase/transferase [Lentisphaerae bacterium]|nr:sulfatase-like hydrolase/transferase [Lentisphaerota bacterium]
MFKMAHKKNVVLFITDGQRADALGCYGNRILRTPNIDAFAAQGVLFRQAFASHSVCMPTRASIFTGRYPHIHGVWANGVALRKSELTLAEVLRRNGYATGAAGKLHFEPQQAYSQQIAPVISGQEPYYGFEEVHLSENYQGQEYLDFIDRHFPELSQQARRREPLPEEAHELQWITDKAIEFIQRHTRAQQPFFCCCSYHELIPPCHPPLPFCGLYAPSDMPVPELRESDLATRPPFYRQCYEGYVAKGLQPDEAAIRRTTAAYYDQAGFIDKQFGRLVAALKEAEVWENTIVVFTTDHGLALGDHYQWQHGPFLFDQVINVPLIWRAPAVTAPGNASAALVEQVDIMPTIIDLCGLPPPAGMQGATLLPIIRQEAGAVGKESVLIQERQAPDLKLRGVDPQSVTQYGLRTKDWKLIHYPNCSYGELYDLRNDPGEFENRWADPGYSAQRHELEHRLRERLAGAADPLPDRHFDW